MKIVGNLKQKLIALPLVAVALLLFGFYSFTYVGIFRDNSLFNSKLGDAGVKLEEGFGGSNVLGEKEIAELKSKDTTELKMNSAGLAAGKTRLGDKVDVGVAVEDYAGAELAELNGKLNNQLKSLSIFKQFGNLYNNSIDLADFAYAKNNNLKLIIAWEPWNPDEGKNQSVDYLNAIVSGSQDGYIRGFAQSIKNYNGEVVIRFGHEMNGNWYPWGGRANEYKAAYRYLVEFFRKEGVKNVSWMWCINSDNVPYTNIENSSAYYPGDDVVDIVGIDGVNFGTSQSGSKWRTFSEIFLPAYSFVVKTYNKPLIISETASSELGGNKSVWIQGMFDSLNGEFVKVSEVVWFSINKETDWRINSSAPSLEAFKRNI